MNTRRLAVAMAVSAGLLWAASATIFILATSSTVTLGDKVSLLLMMSTLALAATATVSTLTVATLPSVAAAWMLGYRAGMVTDHARPSSDADTPRLHLVGARDT